MPASKHAPARPQSRRRRIAALVDQLADLGAGRGEIAQAIARTYQVNMRVAYRLMLGWTQETVAELYNARWPRTPPRTAKTISRWENWKGPGSRPCSAASEPSIGDLLRLADLYGCRVDDLLHTPPADDDPIVARQDRHNNGHRLPHVVWDGDDRDAEGGSPTNRRQALQTALLGASAPLVARSTPDSPGQDRKRITPELTAAVTATVSRAQRLDDSQGGGAALDYVTGQHQALARLIRQARYDQATGSTLLTLLAQLAQTAGFMAYDARDDTTARRWYQSGLDAADHAGDPLLISSILGLLSNQSASCGRTAEAAQLADAARRAAAAGPPIVRALAAARGNLAAAAAGDRAQFMRTLDDIAEHLDQPVARPAPAWAYYVSPTELDAITGRGLVMLALGDPLRNHDLLDQAQPHLRPRVHSHEPSYGRSELRHAAWLALAYLHTGRIEESITIGNQALQLLPHVNSARSHTLLRRFRTGLAEHRTPTPDARNLIHALDTHLTRI